MSILSERLRKLRKLNGLTQKDVADFLGISESGYGYYEQDRNKPTLDNLKKLAAKYDVSLEELTGDPSDTKRDVELTVKEERDVAKRMKRMREEIIEGKKDGEGLNFMGEPMSEEAIDSLLEALEHAERIATLANRKYTPKHIKDTE